MVKRDRMRIRNQMLSCAVAWFVATSIASAQHQTTSFSPVSIGSVLPYQVELRQTTLSGAVLPTLQSFAAAQYDGKWVLMAGRTNGLHGFTETPSLNFPTAFRSHDVWVVDPVTGQSWSRSLETDPNSGLSAAEVVSIGTTNNQFVQQGDRLYMVGGYTGQGTESKLTAIDLAGMVDWVQNGTSMASDHIRQTSDTMFAVTGGAMYDIDGTTHLVFGHNFVGGYRPGKTGIYTKQVRSFEIVDDGTTLSFTNASSTAEVDAYRRRDLNVFPVVKPNGTDEGLVALAGVFTEQDGAWTVPVEIDAAGAPTMADPTAGDTFKQAMNQYHSAKFGIYSDLQRTMHEVLMGGITLQYYDETSDTFVQDDAMPNTSQVTSVSIDPNGDYSQHLLGSFPAIDDGAGNMLRLGANAEFFVAPGIVTYDNGVIDFDELVAGETIVGHVFGGLAANAPHVRGTPGAVSVASNMVFEVSITVLEGDYNRDGLVDAADYTQWRDTLGQSVAAGTYADGSGNGTVDADDYTFWQARYGNMLSQPMPAALSAAVPEPASGLIALFALGVVLGARQMGR
ncbi:MAG: hypothetical protein ACR2NU_12085 [Aeoliella sp.]